MFLLLKTGYTVFPNKIYHTLFFITPLTHIKHFIFRKKTTAWKWQYLLGINFETFILYSSLLKPKPNVYDNVLKGVFNYDTRKLKNHFGKSFSVVKTLKLLQSDTVGFDSK